MATQHLEFPTHANWSHAFRRNAMDINHDWRKFAQRPGFECDRAGAWHLHNPVTASMLDELVVVYRRAADQRGFRDNLSDGELNWAMLDELGAADTPKPEGWKASAAYQLDFGCKFVRLLHRIIRGPFFVVGVRLLL